MAPVLAIYFFVPRLLIHIRFTHFHLYPLPALLPRTLASSLDGDVQTHDPKHCYCGHSEFERDGAVLVVDATSLEFVKGATVDFEEDMMRSAFAVLNNPVSESACGCGSSFALKNFEKNPALD
ncbi:unnamed protein product [Scytosiphon promiscuus]